MIRIISITMLMMTVVMLSEVTAIAADSPVKIVISAQKEVSVVGKDKKVTISYENTGKVKRDDVLVYTIVCENTGKEVIKNIEITDPVPNGMVYIDGSATNAGNKVSQINFSSDKGKTYAAAGKLTYKITDSKGNVVEKAATSDAYTNIKWLIDSLSPGEKVSVQFKAKVL